MKQKSKYVAKKGGPCPPTHRGKKKTLLEWRDYIPLSSDFPPPKNLAWGVLPLEAMEVGESFYLSIDQLVEIYGNAGKPAKKSISVRLARFVNKFSTDTYKPKFSMRATRDGGVRVWRIQ